MNMQDQIIESLSQKKGDGSLKASDLSSQLEHYKQKLQIAESRITDLVECQAKTRRSHECRREEEARRNQDLAKEIESLRVRSLILNFSKVIA